jgi:hypothetical protein
MKVLQRPSQDNGIVFYFITHRKLQFQSHINSCKPSLATVLYYDCNNFSCTSLNINTEKLNFKIVWGRVFRAPQHPVPLR